MAYSEREHEIMCAKNQVLQSIKKTNFCYSSQLAFFSLIS